MRDRLFELLVKKDQFLQDNEILIYVKNNEMTALRNDGESLIETSGDIPKELFKFLEWLNEG